jgi:hypothetical protein
VITAIDTNVFVALWDRDATLSVAAQNALDGASAEGPLRIAAPVYCELMAAPGRTREFIDEFLRETCVAVDWILDESIWLSAGEAFRPYAARRRKQREPGPRRILADFLIGAHAQHRAHRLLTLDASLYQPAFPSLRVASF